MKIKPNGSHLSTVVAWKTYQNSPEFDRISVFFSEHLIQWFVKHGRDLPWRNTRDPYKILLSEMMLQQTQVDRVIDFYHQFLKTIPDFETLATAPEEQVIGLWGGLGYYNRARNLQKIAKIVIEENEGHFPSVKEQISALPGIGDYTTGALMTFALEKKSPIVDTNVERVYQRIFLEGIKIKTISEKQKIFWFLAEQLLPDKCYWEYNQGIMDFGAIKCISGNPKCNNCPFRILCRYYQRNSLKKYFTSI